MVGQKQEGKLVRRDVPVGSEEYEGVRNRLAEVPDELYAYPPKGGSWSTSLPKTPPAPLPVPRPDDCPGEYYVATFHKTDNEWGLSDVIAWERAGDPDKPSTRPEAPKGQVKGEIRNLKGKPNELSLGFKGPVAVVTSSVKELTYQEALDVLIPLAMEDSSEPTLRFGDGTPAVYLIPLTPKRPVDRSGFAYVMPLRKVAATA